MDPTGVLGRTRPLASEPDEPHPRFARNNQNDSPASTSRGIHNHPVRPHVKKAEESGSSTTYQILQGLLSCLGSRKRFTVPELREDAVKCDGATDQTCVHSRHGRSSASSRSPACNEFQRGQCSPTGFYARAANVRPAQNLVSAAGNGGHLAIKMPPPSVFVFHVDKLRDVTCCGQETELHTEHTQYTRWLGCVNITSALTQMSAPHTDVWREGGGEKKKSELKPSRVAAESDARGHTHA